ncbi:MAG: hypothetical protein GY810_03060 [Aureispira sp.]|nr:hypothetical protein [Aureispira sp.]
MRCLLLFMCLALGTHAYADHGDQRNKDDYGGVKVTAQKINSKIVKEFDTWRQLIDDKELAEFGIDFSDWTLIEDTAHRVLIKVKGGIDIALDNGSLFKYIIIGEDQERIELDFEF